MHWWCVGLLLLAACTSPWERHQKQLRDREAVGDYRAAVTQARWLADNAFSEAPADQRTPAAEATRYVRLATVAAKAGKPRVAIEALRQALTIDPHQAPAV